MKQKALYDLRQAVTRRGAKFYDLLKAFGLTKAELLGIEAGDQDYAPLLRSDIWRQLGATEAEIAKLEAAYAPPAPVMTQTALNAPFAPSPAMHAICSDCAVEQHDGQTLGECIICGRKALIAYAEVDLAGLLPLLAIDQEFLQALGRAYQRGELQRLRDENQGHRSRAKRARKLLHNCAPVPLDELREVFPAPGIEGEE
jgi:hypothetical protein